MARAKKKPSKRTSPSKKVTMISWVLLLAAAALLVYFFDFNQSILTRTTPSVESVTTNSCPAVKRAKVDITLSESNGSKANMPPMALGDGSPVTSGQWFVIANGSGFINDPPLTTNNPGIVIRRSEGQLEIFANGKTATTALTVYGTLTVEGATVSSLQNGLASGASQDSLELFGNEKWGVYTVEETVPANQCRAGLFGLICRVLHGVKYLIGRITCPLIGLFCPDSTVTVTKIVYDDEAQSGINTADFYLHYGKQQTVEVSQEVDETRKCIVHQIEIGDSIERSIQRCLGIVKDESSISLEKCISRNIELGNPVERSVERCLGGAVDGGEGSVTVERCVERYRSLFDASKSVERCLGGTVDTEDLSVEIERCITRERSLGQDIERSVNRCVNVEVGIRNAEFERCITKNIELGDSVDVSVDRCINITIGEEDEGGGEESIFQIDNDAFTVHLGPCAAVAGCVQATKQVSAASECSDSNVRHADITLAVRNVCGPTQSGAPLDVLLVLDRSGSMEGQGKLRDAKTAAHALIDELDPSTDRVGLVSYSDTARLDSQLTQDFTAVKNTVSGLQARGETNIGDGVVKARQEFQARRRSNAIPIMIVLTDGIANRTHNGKSCVPFPIQPNTCTQDAINQANTAKSDNITIFTVGFGLDDLRRLLSQQVKNVARATLVNMASSLDHFYEASSGQELIDTLETIGQQITSGDISDVVITDILPSNVRYIGDSQPAPSSITGQKLVWNIGPIGAGQEALVRFQVSFDPSTIGQRIDADVYPDSRVDYKDNDENTSVSFPQTQYTPQSCTPPQCSDGLDNDGDGGIDCADPGCWANIDDSTSCNPTDNNEFHTPTFAPGGFQEAE